MVWDINTKFLPVEDHNRRQLLTKFEGSWCAQIWISCQNILKLKWAWRAQFLSYAFQILQKCITFEDAQMILLALLKILSLNRIFKKSIQLLVHTGAVLGLALFWPIFPSTSIWQKKTLQNVVAFDKTLLLTRCTIVGINICFWMTGI